MRKTIISFLIILFFLVLLLPISAMGFSTHGTMISREFDKVEAAVDEPITVTVSFTNGEADDLRGFYYTEHVPEGLSIDTVSVKIDGVDVSGYTVESGSADEVYPGSVPYRWILETPALFEEMNSLAADAELVIVYTVSSSQAGTFRFDEFSWVGYYPTGLEGQQEAFGHSEEDDKQTITFSDPAPVAVDDAYTVLEGGTLSQTAPGVLDNDTSPVGNPLTAVPDTDAGNGTLILNSDGSFTYTHDGSETTSDSFIYHANDGSSDSNTATVTISITPVNDAPVISGQVVLSTPEENPLTIGLAYLIITDPDNPDPDDFILTVQDGANYSRKDNSIIPDPNFNGTLSVPVMVNDGTNDSNVYDLMVAVTAVNDAPEIVGMIPDQTRDEDAVFWTVDLTGFESDIEDSGTDLDWGVSGVNTDLFTAEITDPDNDLLTLTPVLDAHGSDVITLTLTDSGGLTATTDITVTLTAQNDPPTDFILSASSIAEHQPAGTTVGTFSTSDPDTGDTPIYILVGGAGDDDNASFTITDDLLQTLASFDHETKSSYSIRVRTDDQNGGTLEKQFTITVINVAPLPPTRLRIITDSN
jgi:VCBS repeat-containing protein